MLQKKFIIQTLLLSLVSCAHMTTLSKIIITGDDVGERLVSLLHNKFPKESIEYVRENPTITNSLNEGDILLLVRFETGARISTNTSIDWLDKIKNPKAMVIMKSGANAIFTGGYAGMYGEFIPANNIFNIKFKNDGIISDAESETLITFIDSSIQKKQPAAALKMQIRSALPTTYSSSTPDLVRPPSYPKAKPSTVAYQHTSLPIRQKTLQATPHIKKSVGVQLKIDLSEMDDSDVYDLYTACKNELIRRGAYHKMATHHT